MEGMTIRQVSTKIDIRLNKTASGDYDNLWPYIKEEAFNKAINDWVRRQKNGRNAGQEGDEETAMKVDDLQLLLKMDNLSVRNKGLFVQTEKFPSDYLYYKRLTPIVSKGNCGNVKMKSYLREEANVDDLINMPSFNFEETFHTLINNKAHVYHNNDFTINTVEFTYYRKPKFYKFKNLDIIIEFKDDVCELFVDETCKIISSDLESINQVQLSSQREMTNT